MIFQQEGIMSRMKEASREASDAADAALMSTAEVKRNADDYSSGNSDFADKWSKLKGLVAAMTNEAAFLYGEAQGMVSSAEEALADCEAAREAARQVQLEMDRLHLLLDLNT